MLVRQKPQQLAGEATVPDSVIGSCQVDKDGTGLLFRFECILNALREQSDLIHGGSSASKTRLFPWEQRVNKRFDAGVDKSLENLVGNTEQGDRTIATGFEGFRTATTSALLQILGILRWCRQEDRKPRSQDFKPAPAWIISSGQMESGPGALPGFKCRRAAANSRWEKFPETFAGCNGSALQRSDTSCKTSRDERRFTPSYFPFLTS